VVSAIQSELDFPTFLTFIKHFGDAQRRFELFMNETLNVKFILDGKLGVIIHDVLRQMVDLDNCADPIPVELRICEELEITVAVRHIISLCEL
jgi:hypothetical protein